MNRRQLLGLGVLGGAAALPIANLLPAGANEVDPVHKGHRLGRKNSGAILMRPKVAPFTELMPIPPVLQPSSSANGVDTYRIDIRDATAQLIPGFTTPVLTYAGSFVGPTIRTRTGRRVKVVYTNRLAAPANVHLHGGHVAAVNDGHPMDLIQPGQARTYEYPNAQQGATLWYHDHSHHTEAEHVYRGLHGFYLIDDPSEKRFALPSGQYDVPIMLRDAAFDQNGGLIFFGDPAERTNFLVNGKLQPYFPVAARKYRFRILNAANERVFRLNLGGHQITQIASDGGLLPEPVRMTEIVLSSAERAEIVVDFSRLPIGSQLVLHNGTIPVMRFDVVRNASDYSLVPHTLRPLPALPPASVTRDITMSFDLSGPGPLPVGLVNGRPYDPNRVDAQIRSGATEIWNVSNVDTLPGVIHNFHLHMTHFRVLERDGGPPLPEDEGLKDTVFLPFGGRVKIQATFGGGFTGRYVYHCHFLEHSSLGMMAEMEIIP
ncbi:multicopper oxidase family protein [Nonomuraea longicatena]|uniref:multicopper oxidase family protein n=1 Tax=Nonomuraea longicatena TaxID=83682 RepID=UPI0031DE480E